MENRDINKIIIEIQNKNYDTLEKNTNDLYYNNYDYNY